MFKRGNRLFAAGAIAILLTAILHTLGHFSDPPADPALIAVLHAMNGYRLEMGMARPTIMEIHDSLSLTMTILLLVLGSLDLVVLGLAPDATRLLRALKVVNLLGAAGLAVLFMVYPIPPPMFCFATVSLLFLLSLILQKRPD